MPRKKKRRTVCLILVLSMLLMLTGCDKKKTEYSVNTLFVYTDIQETKKLNDTENEQDSSDIEEDTDELEDEEDDSEPEEPKLVRNDFPNRKNDKDNNVPQKNLPSQNNRNNNRDQNSDQSPDSNQPTDQNQAPAPEQDGPSNQKSIPSEEGVLPTHQDGDPQSGGGTPETPKATDTDATEDPEQNPPDPVSYGLEYEGSLGRYIWGETADTSGLHIYYNSDSGRQEITDYNIEMNYPSLRSYGGISSSYTGAAGSKKTTYNTYDPGIYNARVTYGDYYCEVPYELDVVFVKIDFKTTNYCTDPTAHRSELVWDDTIDSFEFWKGNTVWDFSQGSEYTYCKHCSTCNCLNYEGDYSYSETVGGLQVIKHRTVNYSRYENNTGSWSLYYPLYYDYSFTRSEFDSIGITDEYQVYKDFNYDTLSVSKESMMNIEWAGSYVFGIGTYATYYVLVPEDVNMSWISGY